MKGIVRKFKSEDERVCIITYDDHNSNHLDELITMAINQGFDKSGIVYMNGLLDTPDLKDKLSFFTISSLTVINHTTYRQTIERLISKLEEDDKVKHVFIDKLWIEDREKAFEHLCNIAKEYDVTVYAIH